MKKFQKMFDTLYSTYENIISCIGIVGYLEEDIIKRGINNRKNLELNCLYAYPNKDIIGLNPFTYQMMFPDNNHKIPCPKFFTLTLTNQLASHYYLYCLKFSESYSLILENEEKKEIDVPLVIFIRSEKQDFESFKQLLNIINYIIVNDYLEKEGNLNLNYNNINNYKKVQLMNLFYFLFSLPHAPPHSLVKLKIEKEIINSNLESIDFYFSSNCEIPCNKNDTDINILFLLLDQLIIIKVLFAILTEKQIIFRASQAYLLHLIIPTFLKLIFPFKWIQSCITVLPKEKLNFLEAPGSYIFGVLSDVISLNDLMNEYPGKIVVDCDTNEIFGDSYLEPYEFPSEINIKEEKNKKENENKINSSNKLTQGNNLINIGGSYLYKYESDTNIKRTKLLFKETNNIIIDTKKSQFLIDKTNAFIDSNEWKWLRKNIQLIRNPEIFDLENINHKKNSLSRIYLNDEDDENIILPNRSFSYNIQNIFMIYILNKLNYSKSEFMSIFKHTNLYLSYNDKKKFQNNSGRVIVENISELKDKNQQRNIDNSFIIEYTLQSFKSQIIIEKIDSKLLDKTKIKESEEKMYNKLKLIFNNYNQLKNEEDPNNLEDFSNKESIGYGRKSEMKKPYGRLSRPFFRKHDRNKSSLLIETNSTNYNFILSGADKSIKEVFKFYGKDGFLNFIKDFEKFVEEENIDIKYELYEQKINEQILDIILNSEDIFNQNISFSETGNLSNSLEKTDTLNKKDIKNILMSIPENIKEEEDDKEKDQGKKIDLYYGRTTVIQKSEEGEEYIISSPFKSPYVVGHNSVFNEISDIELNKFLYSENIINFFPNYSEHNEISKNNNTSNEYINHKCQYYLFINLILENILKDKAKSDEFIEKIKIKKRIKEIDIKYLISKIYSIAYNFSGIKHRDFPYFSFYSFLLNIDLDELITLKGNFIKEIDLSEIFENIINEKEIFKNKQLQKTIRKEKLEEEKKLKEIREKELEYEERIRKNSQKIKNRTSKIQDLFKIFENKLFDKKTDKIEHRPSFISSNSEFNLFLSYPINRGSKFESENKYLGFNYLIKNFAEEILGILPKNKDYYIDNQNIILEVNKKLSENTKIFETISQLKYIYPDKLVHCKERICFWANCFNFLLLFTIFYKKWNINGQDDWKYFFQNVKYLIGDKYYTFNDMQYLLFKRLLFFPSSYKNNEDIKKYRVDKTEDAKNIEKKYPLIFNHFLIYLPIKDFIKPIIFEENKLEFQLNERMKEYFSNFLVIDKENNINIPKILNNFQPRFIYKEFKKFQPFLNESIYNVIKEKKYKGTNVNNYEWRINFDSLLKNSN